MAALALERHLVALTLVLVAGISDVLDGVLARRFRWTSRLGAMLDPAADKLFLVSSYVTLAWLGHLPVWLAVVVLLRDVLIVCGAVAYRLVVGPVRMEPTTISKWNTGLQLILVLMVVATLGGVPIPPQWTVGLVWLVAGSSVVSGGHYVYAWSAKALAETRRRDRTARRGT
jgi:cardiolipin synthase